MFANYSTCHASLLLDRVHSEQHLSQVISQISAEALEQAHDGSLELDILDDLELDDLPACLNILDSHFCSLLRTVSSELSGLYVDLFQESCDDGSIGDDLFYLAERLFSRHSTQKVCFVFRSDFYKSRASAAYWRMINSSEGLLVEQVGQ